MCIRDRVDAVSGESRYYEEVPTWVDTLYNPDLIMQQYNYHGTLVRGFINSVLGQRDVTMATRGYNSVSYTHLGRSGHGGRAFCLLAALLRS